MVKVVSRCNCDAGPASDERWVNDPRLQGRRRLRCDKDLSLPFGPSMIFGFSKKKPRHFLVSGSSRTYIFAGAAIDPSYESVVTIMIPFEFLYLCNYDYV